jgi:hypothetical protein
MGAASAHIDSIRAAFERVDVTGSREGERYIAQAVELAQLRLRQRLRELELKHLEFEDAHPLRSSPSYVGQSQSDASEQTIGQLVAMSMAFSAGESAKQEMLSKDAEAQKALVEKAASADSSVRSKLASAQVYFEGGKAFNELVDRELRRLVDGSVSSSWTAAERACDYAPSVDDWILVHGAGGGGEMVALGEARFNKGGVMPVVLRRIGTTNDWAGQIYWPPSATAATVSVGGVTSRLQIGRMSFEDLANDMRRTAERIRKAASESNYRAKGADNIKTVIVP